MRALLIVAFAFLASVAVPPTVLAGTYDVWTCQAPSGLPAPIAGWSPEGGGAVNDCAGRQGLKAALPGSALPAKAFTGWRFDAPAGTPIRDYELFRVAVSDSGPDMSSRAYGLYHNEPIWEPTVTLIEYCALAIQRCPSLGDPSSPDPMDPDNQMTRSGLSIHRLFLRIECNGPGSGDGCDPATGGRLAIGRARFGLGDDALPVLAAPTGAATRDGAFLEGPQALEVSASDQGGGIRQLMVLVDGAPVGTSTMDGHHPTCREPYVALVPCPASASAVVSFPTGAIPNGRHTMQVAAEDAAGNRTVSGGWAVLVANGAVANGVGASRAAGLKARFEAGVGGRRAKEITLDFGAPVRVNGRLVDASGRPIREARIDLMARPARTGGKWRKEGELTTRADGTFRRLVRPGPSRELRLQYRAFSLDPVPAASASVRVNVRAGVRLAVRPKRTTSRGTIRFRGQLRGRGKRGGLQVTLYAIDRSGRRRVPVEVVRTDDRGQFRFRYRFARTFAPFTYRFIARSERQPTYPYAAGSSPTATVRVVR